MFVVASLVLSFAMFVYSLSQVRAMESECVVDLRAERTGGVSFDFSWSPLGFRCTFDDGSSSVSLWR